MKEVQFKKSLELDGTVDLSLNKTKCNKEFAETLDYAIEKIKGYPNPST